MLMPRSLQKTMNLSVLSSGHTMNAADSTISLPMLGGIEIRVGAEFMTWLSQVTLSTFIASSPGD